MLNTTNRTEYPGCKPNGTVKGTVAEVIVTGIEFTADGGERWIVEDA